MINLVDDVNFFIFLCTSFCSVRNPYRVMICNTVGLLANIILVIKSSRMKLEGHVASMGERRVFYRALLGKP
jgi:hypothetical protein